MILGTSGDGEMGYELDDRDRDNFVLVGNQDRKKHSKKERIAVLQKRNLFPILSDLFVYQEMQNFSTEFVGMKVATGTNCSPW